MNLELGARDGLTFRSIEEVVFSIPLREFRFQLIAKNLE
jgi:hypothetical protein